MRRAPSLRTPAKPASRSTFRCCETAGWVMPILIEPGVDLAQRRSLDRVDAPRAVAAHAGEASLAQHLQVLRDRRLGNAELALDDRDDVARAVLAAGEQLQDAAPDRVAQDVEGVHHP